MGANSKHWFTTFFLWRKVPESDVWSVGWGLGGGGGRGGEVGVGQEQWRVGWGVGRGRELTDEHITC